MPRSSTTFQPGRSGNPNGRPKGLEKMTREEIAAFVHVDEELGPLQGWQALRRRLFLIGVKGEDKDAIAAIKLLHDRGFGQAKQQVEVSGEVDASTVDWDAKPLEERRKLLGLAMEMGLLDGDDATEH